MNKYIFLCLAVLLLVGCWDERLLKEHILILGIGYDLAEDKKIVKTIIFPNEVKSGEQGGEPVTTENITVKGNTVKDAEIKTEQRAPERFDRSKAKVLLVGEDLAKEGMFSTLDSIYRDLRSPLSAIVAIVEGEAKDAFEIEEKYSLLTSDFYAELLETSDHAGLIKKEDLQSVCPIILQEGKDVALPMIALDDEKATAKLNGIALFSGDKLKGKLPIDQSIMYLILSNQTKKRTKVNLQVTKDKADERENFVNFSMRHMKRKINIQTDKEKIKVNMQFDLQLDINEYGSDHLYSEKKARELSGQISKQITRLAEETISQMQAANSDVLGVGERIKAHHHEVWKSLDWEESYPTIDIHPTFNVEIIRHGILN